MVTVTIGDELTDELTVGTIKGIIGIVIFQFIETSFSF